MPTGRSESEYHAAMIQLARRWLATDPPRELHAFLDGNFRQLLARYGRVYGTRIPTPRLIPVERGAGPDSACEFAEISPG